MRLETPVFLALLLVACGGEKEVRQVSANPRVKAKSGEVWRNDLQQALALESEEVCVELGQYDCIDDAHRITMGGVEPERLGIDAAIEPSSSSPIAFDRAATSACASRFEKDRAGSPVVFGPVLADSGPEARAEVATTLVKRFLGREPTQDQVDGLVALYDDIAPLAPDDPVSAWSVGACLVVATSVEALFY